MKLGLIADIHACPTKELSTMFAKRIAFVMLLLAGASASSLWLLADDDPTVESPKKKPPPVKTVAPADASGAMLGRTVKLEFRLADQETVPSFFVLCAANEYAISADITRPENNYGIKLTGALTPLGDQGKMLLTHESSLNYSDNDKGTEASFSGKGSAILELGKSRTLTEFGGKALEVTATLDD
jgi:hypothetical protein